MLCCTWYKVPFSCLERTVPRDVRYVCGLSTMLYFFCIYIHIHAVLSCGRFKVPPNKWRTFAQCPRHSNRPASEVSETAVDESNGKTEKNFKRQPLKTTWYLKPSKPLPRLCSQQTPRVAIKRAFFSFPRPQTRSQATFTRYNKNHITP